jgi:hypothetical protein
MSSKQEKDATISKIYYDPAGYGSIITTYNEARREDITISKQFVQGWFSENVDKKRQAGATNSFVAPGPGYEYQVDLFYLSDLKKQKMTYGCVCIDIFTKYAWVVPIPTRKAGPVAFGIIECLKNMNDNNFKGSPNIIYTDGEKAMDLKEFYTERNIKHYVTRNHAAFAERFIRTYKAMLYKRIDGSKETKVGDPQWTDYNYQVLLTYNNKLVHSSTKMTPQKAAQKTNEVDVKTNLELRAKKNRKYPALNIGDQVKIARKKKVNEKERTSFWSPTSYPVESISEEFGQKYYTIQSKQYIRAELLKV